MEGWEGQFEVDCVIWCGGLDCVVFEDGIDLKRTVEDVSS